MYQIKDGWIVFDNNFNKLLSTVVFPHGIQKIEFGWDFNQDVSQLPNNLTHLIFTDNFNQDISQLPKSVTCLRFTEYYDCKFNQSLNLYLYHLTEFIMKNNHKHKAIMLDRCKINQHNEGICSDKLIDLLLKK